MKLIMKSKKRINFFATLIISLSWGGIFFCALKTIELLYLLSPDLPNIPASQWKNPALSSAIAFVFVLTFGRLFLVLKDKAFSKGAGVEAEEQFSEPRSHLVPVVSWPEGFWGWIKMLFGLLNKKAGETTLLVGGSGFEMLIGVVAVFAFYSGLDSPYMSDMMDRGLLVLSVLLICFGYAASSLNIKGTVFWIPYPLIGLILSFSYLFQIYWENNLFMLFVLSMALMLFSLAAGIVSAFFYGMFTRMSIRSEA